METDQSSHNYSHLASVVSKTKLTAVLGLLLRHFGVNGEARWNVNDFGIHRREAEEIGQLVRVTRLPLGEETRFRVKTVSAYANSHFEAEEEQLETLADAQSRILSGLRDTRLGDNYHFLLVFEAEQFELLLLPSQADRRSRSRDSDSRPETRLVPAGHHRVHCAGITQEPTHQDSAATAHFGATEVSSVQVNPQPAVSTS